MTVNLTVPEAAERLGVKPSAVRKAIARGTLPARTGPGRFSIYEYLIADVDVETYRATHRRPRVDWSNVVVDEGDETP